jgi:hypothetical protein
MLPRKCLARLTRQSVELLRTCINRPEQPHWTFQQLQTARELYGITRLARVARTALGRVEHDSRDLQSGSLG